MMPFASVEEGLGASDAHSVLRHTQCHTHTHRAREKKKGWTEGKRGGRILNEMETQNTVLVNMLWLGPP